MKVETLTNQERIRALLGVGLGFFGEVLFIPLPRGNASIFGSGDLYYALFAPFAIWWLFRRFLPSKQLDNKQLMLGSFMFGFYLSSALRAIAITGYRLHEATRR
jgi:hypothetical protein